MPTKAVQESNVKRTGGNDASSHVFKIGSHQLLAALENVSGELSGDGNLVLVDPSLEAEDDYAVNEVLPERNGIDTEEESRSFIDEVKVWHVPFEKKSIPAAIREASLLLDIGTRMEQYDVLVMPEFVCRVLWVVNKAGLKVSKSYAAEINTAWDDLRRKTAVYMESLCDDEVALLNGRDPYTRYDPERVSQVLSSSITPLIDKEDDVPFLSDEGKVYLQWCLLVGERNAGGDSDSYVGRLYSGRYERVDDGNEYWERRLDSRGVEFFKQFKEELDRRREEEAQETVEKVVESSLPLQPRKAQRSETAPQERTAEGGHKGKGNHAGIKGDSYTYDFVKIMDKVFATMRLKKDKRNHWLFGLSFDYKKAEAVLCDMSEKAHENDDVETEKHLDDVYARLQTDGRTVRRGLECYIRSYKHKWHSKK